MLLGLITALAATFCFGFGSVFQARGARAAPRADGIRLGLVAGLVRSWPFVLGTLMDIAGFALSIVALRTLPLFLVQSVTNASLAVTAGAAAWLLGARLRGSEVVAIALVIGGLVLLALGAGGEGRNYAGQGFHVALLVVTGLMLVLTAVLARRDGPWVAASLGMLAGVGFGVTSLAVRVLDVSSVADLLTDPATYALAIGGLGGYLAYALALQRGSVTAATAAGTVTETFGPALVGVLALGDTARPGYAWSALTGFVLAVGGTVVLSRFGDVETVEGRPPDGCSAEAPPARASEPR